MKIQWRSKAARKRDKEQRLVKSREKQFYWHDKFVWWPTRAHEHATTIIWMETVTRRRTNGIHDRRDEYVYGPITNLLTRNPGEGSAFP